MLEIVIREVPANSRPHVVKNGVKAPLCKVCGDESSGFHYGVDSCEGCKGFFRRCITQGMTHKCANEERCEITPFTRNSCQYCRLKKCFAVGMSREASRLGRRPKRLKEASGESKGHSTNVPIAPYPSPAELYRLRMAELQRLLQANGTFKSELMQAFLAAAQASFKEHAHGSNSGQTNGNKDVAATNVPNGNMPNGLESGYSSLNSPASSNSQSPVHLQPPQPVININNFESMKTEPMENGVSPANDFPNTSDISVSSHITPTTSPYRDHIVPLVKSETRHPFCNLNFNVNTLNVERMLEEVRQIPSESRQKLIVQVTSPIVEAHFKTCQVTQQAVVNANYELIRNPQSRLGSKNRCDADIMWQKFLSNMVPEITNVVKFCKQLPGFSEIEQDDQIKLIKQGAFEVLLARFCMLIDTNNFEMFDPDMKVKCSRDVIQAMPMGSFFEEFFLVAEKFNPLDLTDGEIGLFTAVLIICPDRQNLNGMKAILKIQGLFLQALFVELKKNHSDFEGLFMKLMSTIPLFRQFNIQHSVALNNIRMTLPDTTFQFPQLHKEVFDTGDV